jgi:hypothetical protein
MTQGVEHLPAVQEALGSIPNTARKERKKNNRATFPQQCFRLFGAGSSAHCFPEPSLSIQSFGVCGAGGPSHP